MLLHYFHRCLRLQNHGDFIYLRQKRKAFTSTNKGLYSELYAYVSDVAKLGKIIFQGEQKASEYTIDHLIAMVNASRTTNKNSNSDSQL